jgi:acyl-CoA thioesterase I
MARQLASRAARAALVVAALVGALAHMTAAFAEVRPLKLVALGDSLTAGYGLAADAALPAVQERLLRAKGERVDIVNAGVSGDTASGGLDRLDWSVPDGTDGVIVALGANDMLRGTDPAVTQKALEEIVVRLKARGIPVMLAGMLAGRNLGEDYVRRFDRIYPDLAAAHDLVLFLLEGVAGERALNLPDGIHPTRQGVERIAERMLPSVEGFVARVRARKGG